jgi:hypothetical protein
MSIEERRDVPLTVDDHRLVDLLASVLVDPNLHTDARMRLHEQIAEILHGTHQDLHGPAGRIVHARALEEHGGRLPDLLRSVLVDPNLHTDMRMRLHQQISEMLDAARSRSDRQINSR